jgi:hypothetical protein
MNNVFYENVRLNYPEFLLLEYDGPTLKRKIKPKETLVNQIIIPYSKKRRLKLFKRVVRMIRAGKAYLERDFLVTPTLKFIKSTPRILQQFQTGGYNIRNGIVRRKRRVRQDDGPMEQRRKIEDNFNPNLFQLVNVSYRIWFIMHLSNRMVLMLKWEDDVGYHVALIDCEQNSARMDVHFTLKPNSHSMIHSSMSLTSANALGEIKSFGQYAHLPFDVQEIVLRRNTNDGDGGDTVGNRFISNLLVE